MRERDAGDACLLLYGRRHSVAGVCFGGCILELVYVGLAEHVAVDGAEVFFGAGADHCGFAAVVFFVVVGSEAEAGDRQLAAAHELVHVVDGFLASHGSHLVVVAHDERFLGAGLDAEAAHDAAHEVDLEALRAFLDLRVVVLIGDDGDAVGRAHGLAHIAGDAFGVAVFPAREDVNAAEPVRVLAALLGVADRRDVAAQHVLDRHRQPVHYLQ